MAAPKVYVHRDINPPRNPKEFLRTNDVVVWEADLGQGPMMYQYDPKTGNWMPVSPKQKAVLFPPVPQPTPPPGMEQNLGGTGAGTTRATMEGTSARAQAERDRARREGEMRSARSVGDLQERAAGTGTMAGLSLGERAAAQQLINAGATEAEAVAEIVKRRTAEAQAGALEAQR